MDIVDDQLDGYVDWESTLCEQHDFCEQHEHLCEQHELYDFLHRILSKKNINYLFVIY